MSDSAYRASSPTTIRPGGLGSSVGRRAYEGTGPDRADEGGLERSGRSRALPPLAAMLLGQMLGHFELVEYIGGGGMGVVFKGVDTTLDRLVAVKILSSAGENEDLVRRFRKEAQSAARLDHDHIARVFYVGEDRGLNYIVFEYIDGVNLRDLVEQSGPLPIEDALDYTLQICEALQHAYRRDVIHRDIKPSNILVTPQGWAKLVDMGLARMHHFDSAGQSDLTASGMTLGTFDYISPEQARDPRATDVRSDLYSLGCTLYYLLTGLPPFPDGSALQKMLSHSSDPPPDPRRLRKDLPPGVVTLLRTALAKRPSDRFQTPGDFAAEIVLLAEALGYRRLAKGHMVVVESESRGAWWPTVAAWTLSGVLGLTMILAADWFLRPGTEGTLASVPSWADGGTLPPPRPRADTAAPASVPASDSLGPGPATESLPGGDGPANVPPSGRRNETVASAERPSDLNASTPSATDSGASGSRSAANREAGPASQPTSVPPGGAPTGSPSRPSESTPAASFLGPSTGSPDGGVTAGIVPQTLPIRDEVRNGSPREWLAPPGGMNVADGERSPTSSALGAATDPTAGGSALAPVGTSPSAPASQDRGSEIAPSALASRSASPSEGATAWDRPGDAFSPDRIGASAPGDPSSLGTNPLRLTPAMIEAVRDGTIVRLAVGASFSDDEADTLTVAGWAEALALLAEAPGVTTLELRYDGFRPVPAVTLRDRNLAIVAAEGFRPGLMFTTEATSDGRRAGFDLAGGSLKVAGVSIELELTDATTLGWDVFSLRSVESVQLRDTVVTITESPAVARRGMGPDAALFGIRDRDDAPTDREAAPNLGLQLDNVLVRGSVAAIRSRTLGPLRLNWRNGLFISDQPFLDAGEGPDVSENDAEVLLDFTRVTLATPSVARLFRRWDGPPRLHLVLRAKSSIFRGQRTLPLITFAAENTIEDAMGRVSIFGWDNRFVDYSGPLQIETMNDGLSLSYREAAAAGTFEQMMPEYEILWRRPPSGPLAERTAEDYMPLDPILVGGGFQADLLPSPLVSVTAPLEP